MSHKKPSPTGREQSRPKMQNLKPIAKAVPLPADEAFLNEASDTLPCPAEPPAGPTEADARALHERLYSLFAQVKNGVLGVSAAIALAAVEGWVWHDRFDGAMLPNSFAGHRGLFLTDTGTISPKSVTGTLVKSIRAQCPPLRTRAEVDAEIATLMRDHIRRCGVVTRDPEWQSRLAALCEEETSP